MKHTLYIQAISHGGDHHISVNSHKFETGAIIKVIDIDEIQVDIELPNLSQDNLQRLHKEELQLIKDNIMKNAQQQCDNLGE